MKRDQRLRRSEDFRHVRATASRPWSHPLMVLYATPNGLEHSRVGVTTGKRIGNSVVRNRVRRRIREAIRVHYPDLRPGQDVVLIARAASVDADWPSIAAAVAMLLNRSDLRAVPSGSSA